MKKEFLKVYVGSRGCLEDVDVVVSSYDDIKEMYEKEFDEIEDMDYVEEFCSLEVDEEKGLISIGLNEEEGVWYIDMSINRDLCDEISKLDVDEDDDEIVNRIWRFVG
jgi:hypothetical protein